MPNVRPVPTPSGVVASAVNRRFIRRFAIAMLLMAADTVALIVAGPIMYRSSVSDPLAAAVSATLTIALLASLARMWFLTFRDRYGR